MLMCPRCPPIVPSNTYRCKDTRMTHTQTHMKTHTCKHRLTKKIQTSHKHRKTKIYTQSTYIATKQAKDRERRRERERQRERPRGIHGHTPSIIELTIPLGQWIQSTMSTTQCASSINVCWTDLSHRGASPSSCLKQKWEKWVLSGFPAD